MIYHNQGITYKEFKTKESAKPLPGQAELPVKKEPWQMTREEYENFGIETRIKENKIPIKEIPYARITYQNDNLIYHSQQVKKALSEGKPVPPEVLKDYPDLANSLPVPLDTPTRG